jgi:putative membrane protein
VAVSNAARPGVRSFGQQMISDHGREVKEADRVARKVHLRLPDAPSAEQQKVVWIFSQFTGPAFDCVYISNEYNDHQADIAEAELELANGHNATVKAFARRWLKVYKQHDHMASDLLLGTQSCH